jgi:CPA2 family monovalent cation:H+ antiporter-2
VTLVGELDFLRDLVVVFGVSIGIVYAFDKLRVPALVGFLVAGTLIGPYGLNIVRDISRVEVFAEIGIVLLLFTIGVEFSLAHIRSFRSAVGGGLLQIGLTILLSAAVGLGAGLPANQAVLWGFLTAMSSTAIVFKMLSERNETTSPHGMLATGVLIVQDLAVVPMMVLVPVLSLQRAGGLVAVLWPLAKAVVLVGLILIAARFIVPRVLAEVVRSRSRELFVVTVIVVCLGIAWLSAQAGLSLALGAFIAGLIVSESEYSHQALAEILPLRDGFTSLFFISIGMLLDLRILAEHPLIVGALVIAIVVGKAATAGGAAIAVGYPWRHAILMGFALAQVGEFSFILAKVGQEANLLSAESFQIFLAVSIITMMLTPLGIHASAPVVRWLETTRRLRRWLPAWSPDPHKPPRVELRDHTIIAGYGINGRNLARILNESDIPFVVVDLNGEVVRKERKRGAPIHLGDVTHPRVLHHLAIAQARVLVIAISDPLATRRAIAVAKQLNPALRVIVRTRYLREIDDLHALGADQVVPEEFETSIEIFGLVLQDYHVPLHVVAERITRIRREGYTLLRRGQPVWKELVTERVEENR